ncbi:biotin--[acetyl-CoA-carboxylase] ligase [Brevibacterium album]|uniref:biotin--[acetyl-CoA-carboxylase] ligase n=1 Tax=Brevibacterium album TaxID=417948 RepID=UPI0012ECB2FB|nr:biotin--[acetyl-CoA-carboxylase] ligase [Brevibacterium album]
MHREQYRTAFSQVRLDEAGRRAGSGPIMVHEWPAERDSTNTRLAALLESGVRVPDFAVVGADHQVGGQGRLGRTWSVPARAALTFSVPVAVPAGTDLSCLGWIPVVTGLAVTRALADLGVEAGIKWPNDVLSAEGRKLCGILSRLVLLPDGGRTVVVGIGTNVSLTEEELPVGTATSILLEGGRPDREALLAAIMLRLPGLIREVLDAGPGFSATRAAAEVREAMVTLGSRVRVHLPGDTSFTGTAAGLDAEANLLVRRDAEASAGGSGAGAPAVDGGAVPAGQADAAGQAGLVRVSAGDVVHVRPA